ncbi:MAG: hypothetical protein JWL97_3751 [Gemmatimonadales bacterium]|jgi:hypothetical protein|nr:hypothetical protein [Gemmatimonadales bacterium]
MVEGACTKLQGRARRWPDEVRIRSRFVCRSTPAPCDPSDRKLPARRHRPPATRLLSPRGIALRFYLIALCEAQMRTRAGETPTNHMPLLAGGDDTGWTDLIAVPVEAQGAGITRISRADKKRRMVISAIEALAHPEVQLVHLPHGQRPKAKGKYEEFRLLDEGGVREDGEVPPYTVPRKGEKKIFSLPSALFSNGWIHLLDNTELAFLMMIALDSEGRDDPVKIPGDDRILYYGLGRDAYEAHLTLEHFGLIDVEIARNRHDDMKVADYGNGGKALLHSFTMIPDGFKRPALTTIRQALKGNPTTS